MYSIARYCPYRLICAKFRKLLGRQIVRCSNEVSVYTKFAEVKRISTFLRAGIMLLVKKAHLNDWQHSYLIGL